MLYGSLEAFLSSGRAALRRGPVAMILVEDLVEVESTIRHHLQAGFQTLLVFAPEAMALPADLAALAASDAGEGPALHRITDDMLARDALTRLVNPVIAAAPPGTWLYYCFNAEYLIHPFCETRGVGEMLAFHASERRNAMLTYAVDLYAADLAAFPDAVSRDTAMLDRSGYYAQARRDRQSGRPLERQLDFFGGLRWRFEEHVPPDRRRIDRIALFRARPGLTLRPDHTFNDDEYNTYACPWHHNLTAAIASFRVAKALRTNPGSRYDIRSFRWYNSVPFEWSSMQLMNLGLMEPGQWF